MGREPRRYPVHGPGVRAERPPCPGKNGKEPSYQVGYEPAQSQQWRMGLGLNKLTRGYRDGTGLPQEVVAQIAGRGNQYNHYL